MYELYPYFTNDGSIGLFSPEADDIYHSTYGALTEAYEKFILPANIIEKLKKNKKIKVLDICYGIGYNTKSLLQTVLNFLYTEEIGSDNIICNDKIYSNNKKYNIFVHAIDTDENLALLSPFFVSDNKSIKNNKLPFNQEKIERILVKSTVPKYKLTKETNIILLKEILKYINNEEIEQIMSAKKYNKYFDKYMINLKHFYKKRGYKSTPLCVFISFLHNIYYKYISKSHKRAVNCLKLLNFSFKLSIEDARSSIIKDNNKYNYIFLDAFTPIKCPCLWTIDFFKLLFTRLEEDGMILTYSNSAQIRNAFINAGFLVGKIYSESQKKFTGTIAVKNISLIKNELSKYDLGLLKTRAGIFYRDKNLNALNDEISASHKKEVESSELISSSKFIKRYNKENNYETV